MEQLIVADTALAGFSSSCLQPDCSLLPSCISSLLSVSHFLRFPLQYWVNVCEEKVKVHEHWYLSYFTYSVCPLQVLWPWVRSKLYTTGYLTQFIVTFCLFRSLWHLVFSWPSQNHTSLQATQQVDKWSCEVDGYRRLVARRIFHGAYMIVRSKTVSAINLGTWVGQWRCQQAKVKRERENKQQLRS